MLKNLLKRKGCKIPFLFLKTDKRLIYERKIYKHFNMAISEESKRILRELVKKQEDARKTKNRNLLDNIKKLSSIANIAIKK